MHVEVILCTFNRAAMLADALESLLRQQTGADLSFEVVVVDNASTDGTRVVVEGLTPPPGVRLRYAFEPRQGLPHARNRGLRETTAEWIAFFDDDQLASPAWLRELASVARATGARCVAGSVTLVAERGATPRLAPFCRVLLGETPRADRPRPITGKLLPAGNTVLFHRSVFEAVGTFDERLGAGTDDTDLFRRMRRAGYALWYAPAASAQHRIPPYRLGPAYLLWVASRHGAEYATMERNHEGAARVIRDAVLRAGHAALLIAPRWAWARARGDAAAALDARCRVARAVAYGRQTLRLLAPRLFAQRRFFERLEFRGERKRFAGASPAPA
jgi:glycosyltransferase involved in cell wall biosynthesis